MLRKRLSFSAVLFAVLAIAAGLALLQMGRRRMEAQSAQRAVKRPSAPACTPVQSRVEQLSAESSAPAPSPVVVRLNYAGAEGLVNALERDSLTDADVDSLLRIPGLCAMVDNVTRFFPEIGAPEFRQEIRRFAQTKKRGEYDGYFRFDEVWKARSAARALIAAIQTNQGTIVSEMISQLEPYRPDTGRLVVTAYFVVGGVSTGFAFENDPGSLYANVVAADGDLNGVVLNLAHEAYHVMQVRAQQQAGMDPRWLSSSTAVPIERLFGATLAEGTANYVADPTRWTAPGSNMERARERYRRNAEPNRVAKNFALLDDMLMQLQAGRTTWEKAYMEGFTSKNDDSFYFVGYEMTRAVEQYCGRECIGRLFKEPPVEFFRRYIALYHQHSDVRGRFSQKTEAIIATWGNRPSST